MKIEKILILLIMLFSCESSSDVVLNNGSGFSDAGAGSESGTGIGG